MNIRLSVLFAALCLAAPAHAEVTWSMPGRMAGTMTRA